MRPLSLVEKFSIASLAVFVLLGAILGWIITSSLERNLLHRSGQVTASFIADAVRREFNPGELTAPATTADYERISRKVNHLTAGPDVVRLKIWNREMVVVWSDDRRLVGRAFPDNHELALALGGDVVSKLSSLEKREQEYERGFGRLLELYIPVKFPGERRAEIIFEVYQELEQLVADIGVNTRLVWFVILFGLSFLYLALFGLVWGASRRLKVQTEEIARSEEKYRSLVQSAHDGIISVDASGTVILFNRAAEEIFGYPADDVIGRSPSMLVPDWYRLRHEEGMRRVRRQDLPVSKGGAMEVEGKRRDGTVFPLEISLSISGAGSTPLVTAVARDISERRRMQEQLVEAERQASIAVIAGSIGHEINNAIGGVLAYTELLTSVPEDREVVLKWAEICSLQLEQLKVHAQNLLSLSAPREPDMKPVEIAALLDRVVELLQVSGVLKDCSVVRHYDDGLPPVWGDEMLLEQITRNLMLNAAQAMERIGIITLSVRESGDRAHVELVVADTGHGVPPERRGKIFLPFYTTKKGAGTGLGMYITKQVVEQHHGYIRLESEEGKGTEITIGLPVVREGIGEVDEPYSPVSREHRPVE